MNCPKCNAVNNPDARFCGSCGYDLLATLSVNANNQQKEVLGTITPTPTAAMIVNPQLQQLSAPTIQPEITQPQIQQGTPQVTNGNQTPKKSNKSVLIILGVLLAVVVIVVSIILLLNMTPSEKKEEQAQINKIFNPDQLIKVAKDDKYGYIDTKGKFVIEPIYEYATAFQGDYAVVRAEIEIEGLTKTVYQIIDTKGKVKQQADLGIEYIEETDSWIIDGELYNKSMKKISPENVKVDHEEKNYYIWVNSKENTGGIMNEKGKQVYTYAFQSGENSIYLTVPTIDDTQTERYCIVNVERKYGIINCDTGTVIQDMAEVRITGSDNIFTIKDRSTYEFKEIMYIQNDKKMYSSTNEEIDLYYYPGYVSIRDGSKSYDERYTYLHTQTGEIKNNKPAADENSENNEDETLDVWEKETQNKKFSCSTGYGLTDDKIITLPCEWDRLDYLNINLYKYLKENKKDYIYGEKDGKWYLIDLKEKKAIIEFNASYINTPEESTFIYYTDKASNNKKVYNLLSNKSLSVGSDKTLTVYSNYITVKDRETDKIKYYNTNLEMIYEEI